MGSSKSFIDINVNGMMHSLEVKNNWTLLKVLRDELGLSGAKCGCDKGQCGACTVLVNGKPALSCLTLAVAVHEQEITTIEGLAVGGYLGLGVLNGTGLTKFIKQCRSLVPP